MNLLPNSRETEATVLGTMLVYNQAIPDVLALIGPEVFYYTPFQKVFRAIRLLYESNKPVDSIVLHDTLRENGEVPEDVATEMSMLSGDALTGGRGIDWHAKRLRELWGQREIVRRSETLLSVASDATEDYDEVLAYGERLTEGLELVAGEFTTIEQAVDGAMKNIEWSWEHKGQVRGLPIGTMPGLTEMLNGFQGSDYYILAARPSEGKTALGLEIARQASKHAPVLFVSREMPASALAERMMSRDAQVNSQLLRSGYMSDDARRKVHVSAGCVKSLPVSFDERSVTADDVRASVRKAVRTKGVKLVVVDYLQLIDPPRGIRAESRDERVTQTSRLMKRIAVEHNIAMLVLAQLNRALDARGDKRPQLSDLRESGSIEQDCDTAMFLYHPRKHGDKDTYGQPIQDNRMEIIVRKQRNGPTGTVDAYFDADTGTIGERSYR